MKKFYLILTCAVLCACGGGNKQQAVQSDGSFTIDNHKCPLKNRNSSLK